MTRFEAAQFYFGYYYFYGSKVIAFCAAQRLQECKEVFQDAARIARAAFIIWGIIYDRCFEAWYYR